ncbi:MAG: asparagine synthase-related protein [Acidimicrobiia bacterium]
MGSIGALTGAGPGAEARLRGALGRSPHRGKVIGILVVDDVAIGATCISGRDGGLHLGSEWSVAFAGVIDAVGTVDSPDNPAERIAQAIERDGPAALARVRGDFTCVATDGHRLVAARDHLGTDALFVGRTGSVAAVMSEPKQVVAALGISRRANIDALVSVYFSQWEASDDVPSVVQGVDRVPRAAIVEVTGRGWRRIGRVWDPESLLETSRLSVAEAAEVGWSVIEKAVGRSLTSRSAITLSGGIDSTVIAAAAAGGAEGVGAVSAVYPHAPSVDESEYINATAKSLDIELTTYTPERERLDSIRLWVDRIDGPSHGLAIGPVSEMNDVAAAAGYDTLLGGEMAELVYDLREHALAGMVWRRRGAAVAEHIRGLRERGMSPSSLVRLVAAGMVPSPVGLAYARRFRRATDPASWLDRSFMPGLDRRWAFERPARRRWSDIQLFFAVGPSFPGLEASTVMGDVAGVRTRRPLTDRDVWEFFLSLPPEVKFPDAHTKSLIRLMLDGRAPDEVVWRTDKTVFDEDSLGRAEYPFLIEQLSDGFRMPGVDYTELLRRLDSRSLTMWELSMARTLVSIHAFVSVSP